MSEHVSASTGPHDPSSSAAARWARWSSELHESLASQEASAAELQQDLEYLRRSLDAPALTTPPPSQPGAHRSGGKPSGFHRARPHRSRSLLVGATGVALTLAVAGLVTLAARPGATASASGPRASATRVKPPTTAATAAAAGAAGAAARTPGAAPAAPPLPAWPGRTIAEPPGLPAHGVGADVSGTELTAAISAGHTVEVYERALMPQGARTLIVRPAGSPRLVSSLGAPLPVVEELHAQVSGRTVPVTRTGAGWTVTAPGAATADHLVLRYRLTGALIRHEPAPPGRYLLVLTPLLLTPLAPSGSGDGAVVVRIQDPRVEEMYCPDGSNPLCGTAEGELHTATVPAGTTPVVVALVTFPS